MLRTREHVPEGSVLHAIRAAELLRKEPSTSRAREAQRALTAPLPDAPRGQDRRPSNARVDASWGASSRVASCGQRVTRQHRAILALLQDGAPSAASASWRRRLRGVTPLGDPVR